MVSAYDIDKLENILDGEGDWFTAYTLRYLDKVVFKADNENFKKLYTAFPEECKLILEFYGWSGEQILERVTSAYSNV